MATRYGANACYTKRSQIEFDMTRSGGSADTNYKESFTPQSINSSYHAIVPWEKRERFVVDMIGEHKKVGIAIERGNPQPHFMYPFMYCVGCELVRGLGALTYDASRENAVKYEEAEYLCTFSPFMFDVREDGDVGGDGLPRVELCRYVERKRKQIGQSIQANGLFEYGSPNVWPISNRPVPTPPAIQVPYTQLQYIWHYVPGSLDNLIQFSDAYYGTLNSTAFDRRSGSTIGGYDIGTLMYLGMESERLPLSLSGNFQYGLWKVTHNFAFFRQGWNRAYRPNFAAPPDDWDTVRNRATGLPPYELQEHHELFQL